MSHERCPVCGLAYVKDNPADCHMHRRYHDQAVNGICGSPRRSEKVIWRDGDRRIVVVTPFSPRPERVRARKVGQLANREMHSFGNYHENEPADCRNLHLFLYGLHDRIVGLAIFERRDHVCWCTWKEYDHKDFKDLALAAPIWSLGLAWVLCKYRRQGIARTLLEQAICFLKVRRETVGLYTPFSEDGEWLARTLFPAGFLIAK